MATLKDIAQRAGVTATTVSRVINNRGYISEGTRKKVYAAMEEMHYQPNELARAFSKQYTNTIGLIVPHISHPFFTKVISNIESSAAEVLSMKLTRTGSTLSAETLIIFQSWNRIIWICACQTV